MLLSSIQLFLASFVPRVAAFCGTPPPSEAFKAVHAGFLMQGNQSIVIAIRAAKEVIIDTYAHVQKEGSSVAEGNIEDETISDQVNVINDAFLESGFAFKLVNISRTRQPDWRKTAPVSPKESEMKTALRKGSYADLNIYFDTIEGRGVLGYAYLPQVYEVYGHRGFIIDGIVIDPGSAPGGLIEHYHKGLTAVHEIGHWLGLLHTFEDGCKGPGDYVDDTPAEENPEELARARKVVEDCPADRDSCPSLPGQDPVHNYMDYTDNPCQNQFTPGQRKRMQEMWGCIPIEGQKYKE